ncbi:hypothetical protein DS745_23035 [Anaerobacillus alkaliphilus]|uniref:SLH domain-containing protein n=1 Tax=Anaerobacillus alkaliphilus TaxID=1548597 RepID=A0A4Q0VML4_9BACI|nr:S-layer homology domain-containing protein [Anaerobacillus alkaliphilus]RXI96581.1 hypothetical protein DS745_23035 [Anaerobacillus alkaliphilus]
MKRKFKNLLMFFLVIIIVQPLLVMETKASTIFPDVSSFRSEILFLNKRGVIGGYPNGNFGPNENLKRVDAILMIMRELDIPLSGAPNPNFKDVPTNHRGYLPIAKATQLGIISGDGKGSFHPDGLLTRGQMAKILVNAFELKGEYRSNFNDVSKSHIFYDNIQVLAAHNITRGFPDGSFKPSQHITRAHFAAFMSRLLNDDFKTISSKDQSLQDIIVHEQSVVMIELYDEDGELYSQGSGFVVANQLIATNFHVISGGVRARAITSDGIVYELEGVVAYDDYYDMALLKSKKQIGLPTLPLVKYSDVRRGENVVAFGSPLGLQNTVTTGIVSGKHSFEDDFGPAVLVIQTTAPITFGSSGGPLVNMKGAVVGVNSFGLDTVNFAIATDYIRGLIKDFSQMRYKHIPVQTFASMPVFDYEFEDEYEDYVPVGPIGPIEEQKDVKDTRTWVNDLFVHAIHDPNSPIIYGINDQGDVVSFNYETNERKVVSFAFPAERIFQHKDEIFVTIVKGPHSSFRAVPGGVGIIDVPTFTMKNYFNIDLAPYDVVADDHHFYVSSGSNQWTQIKSYHKETGEEVSSAGIRQRSRIALHPSGDRIYTVNSDSSPRDMNVYQISNGAITNSWDSPYHGDYRMATDIKISPDGLYIFNFAGSVFRSTRLNTTDMRIVTDIGVKTNFRDISFSSDLSKFYVVDGPNVLAYSYSTFLPIETYKIAGDGRYIFNHKGQVVLVGEGFQGNSKLTKTFVARLDIQ